MRTMLALGSSTSILLGIEEKQLSLLI